MSPDEVKRRVPVKRAYFLSESFWGNFREPFMKSPGNENYYKYMEDREAS